MVKKHINITVDEDIVQKMRYSPEFNISQTVNKYLRNYFNMIEEELLEGDYKEEQEKLKITIEQFTKIRKELDEQTAKVNLMKEQANKKFLEMAQKREDFRNSGAWEEITNNIG